jgi:hypothetical protein
MYPNQTPTCMSITNADIAADDSPMPPLAGSSARYAGTQLFWPQ